MESTAPPPDAAGPPPGATRSTVTLHVNGVPHRLTLDHRTTALDALRNHLGLTGTKKGCDHGQCGACTVLVDGRRANSCLLLAVTLDGSALTTVEGLADAEGLHPLQTAFVERDAFQCGYCTPGQLCSAAGVLQEAADGHPCHVTPDTAQPGAPVELTAEEIRERMSGNLCRCGAYPRIVEAIGDATAHPAAPPVPHAVHGLGAVSVHERREAAS
ncbi:2Fe-2S iron-sulfur cluster-binding protein [Streptomyces catenulae]|uniref:2Fe-2S iron-sulfur cluster-binding protein n=1 Tax=Streptomyces catenulae TaxID=66875 RepID=A0ABV2Z4Z7_9ACTN|nr:2Fe-2S iron-sulfur cluster-binding protein [Streptomyces catenulae]